MQFSEDDIRYMRRAIELAKQGQYTTTPNPNVGCVIVKDGRIVGEGFHIRAGEPHAEVHALRAAQEQAVGATAYVTLEPCSHYGRTPPCAKGLIEAGVSKVIAAMVDTNPQVVGKGLAMLQAAGIETAFGLLEQEARALNTGFFKRMEQGLPYVSCKLAASLDGKTALANGQSQWITSVEAREDVQRLRAQSCAVLSGADTVLVDNAKLNVRKHFCPELQNEPRQPLRVIIDSQGRLTPELAFFSVEAPILLVRINGKPLENNPTWPHFVEEIYVDAHNNHVDCRALLSELAKRGVNRVFLEAGQTLAGVFHEADLIDEYIVYVAPKILGEGSKGLFSMTSLTSLSDVTQLIFSEVQPVGVDLRIHAKKVR
jgi:diaminohydroxyphosphoribosylaminopyrimidine deaminase/5-amino-6-(5-phosphoribosylamino)uracil reductase